MNQQVEEIIELKEQLDTAKNESEEQARANSDLASQLDSAAKRRDELAEKSEALESELSQAKASLREAEKLSVAQKSSFEKLQAKYNQESDRLKDILFQFDELQREFQANQKELKELKSILDVEKTDKEVQASVQTQSQDTQYEEPPLPDTEAAEMRITEKEFACVGKLLQTLEDRRKIFVQRKSATESFDFLAEIMKLSLFSECIFYGR